MLTKLHSNIKLVRRLTTSEVIYPQRSKGENYITAEDAIKLLNPKDSVYIHGISCNPQHLVRTMCKRAENDPNFNGIHLYNLHLEGEAPFSHPKFSKQFRGQNLFLGGNCRQAVNEKRADWMPIFLHEVPLLFEKNILDLNVAFISVSPPDKNGYMSFGPDVTSVGSAVKHAKIVIAQVNKYIPRVHGHSFIHVKDCTALVKHDEPLPGSHAAEKVSDMAVMDKIGRNIAEIVEDGIN